MDEIYKMQVTIDELTVRLEQEKTITEALRAELESLMLKSPQGQPSVDGASQAEGLRQGKTKIVNG